VEAGVSSQAKQTDRKGRFFMRARLGIAIMMISAGSILGISAAGAYDNPILWTYGSNNYNTQGEALAAMWAVGGWSSVLTVPKPPSAMSHYGITYPYVAPPQSPSHTDWVYQITTSGSTSYYSSESDAAAALGAYYSAAYVNPCGSGSLSPSGAWTYNQPGSAPPYGSNDDFKTYTFTWPDYDDNPTPTCMGTLSFDSEIIRTRVFSCPAHYTLSSTTAPYCIDNDTNSISSFPDPCSMNAPNVTPKSGNPCDAATGDKFQTETDYSGPILPFVRYYHSLMLEGYHGLGVGWTHNYAALLVISGGQPAGLIRPDGHQDPLQWMTDQWVSLSGASIHVQASGSNWVACLADGSQELYNGTGSLIELIDPAGLITRLSYNDDGTLSSVVGPFGHSLLFTYSGGLITQVTDPAGNPISYTYDSNNNLTSVTYEDSHSRTYLYENSTLVNNLTGIIDENGSRYSTYAYNSYGQVTSSTHAGGADSVSLSYGSSSTTVTDGAGTTTVFGFTTFDYFDRRVTSVSRNGNTQSFSVAPYYVDVQQRTTQSTDELGNVTNFTFDRDHLTSKTEAAGTGRERTTAYSYLSVTNALPTDVELSTPGGGELKDVATSYNSQSLPISETQTGYTSGTATVARTSGRTYYSNGQLETVVGPRTDVSQVTTYTYNSCTTGSGCGQIHTVTDAASHVTTYNTYNALGQPLTITDPNGVVTTRAYDARGRLTSRAVGSETTSIAYYPTGLLETVTLPDSSYLQYTYDSAHRLTEIADGAGNSIVYTLDAMGNRTAENAYDPSSVLSRAHSRVINTLNQLYQDVGSAGTSGVTTTYSYDVAGNLTTTAAPLSRTTTNAYDELSRLSQVTDPASGHTYFTYDANNKLTSVQDPMGYSTAYTYDGLGDLIETASPDTGTTAMTYDSGGNLSTSTDARSQVASFSYDALNRTTVAGYSDQTIDYTYDSGTNGVGHLTGASDSDHSMSWQYDSHGRVTSKSQTVGSITKTLGYSYTDADLVSMTTPSGQTIAYTYSNHQISAISVNGSSLLSSVQYEPFGPVRGWTWSNSTTEVRLHDTDWNPSAISGLESTSYTVDNAFRITAIANASNSALSWSYGYDSLDRLTSASQTGNSQSWTYNANGNRLTQGGTLSSSYSISSSNNQISSISGTLSRSYSYDDAGNTTDDSMATFSYNDRSRMASATASSATTDYLYNALGQRIEKSGGPAGTVLFMYDETGHMIGEYDGSGTLIEETVWMGDVPVATLRPSGSTTAVYYIHADHLNSPRMVTRPSDNGILWRWDTDPFGTVAPNENPQSLGTFVYNLRFPGQYYDAETGLYYNYMRDYDAQTGRYIESDPIGLKGGVNTYAYVQQNPISRIDPTGLAQKCPLKLEVLISIAPLRWQLTSLWLCTYDCNTSCPGSLSRLVTELQLQFYPDWGCRPYYLSY
jgi:RHS repeat-associated protein